MDVQQVKQKHEELKALITSAIQDFQDETGLFVSLVAHNRKDKPTYIDNTLPPVEVPYLVVDLTVNIQ